MKQDSDSQRQKKTQRHAPIAQDRIAKIVDQYRHKRKHTVYTNDIDKSNLPEFRYIFPVSEVILLNLLSIFDKARIVDTYVQDKQDKKTCFVEFQTDQDSRKSLVKLSDIYHVEDYQKFETNYLQIVQKTSHLPEYVWIQNFVKPEEIEAHLSDYSINYSYLDENFLIEKGEQDLKQQYQIVIEKIKDNYSNGNLAINQISSFLLIDLLEDDINLLKYFEMVEKHISVKEIYWRYSNSNLQFILELKSIFQMLKIKSILIDSKIPFKYLSRDEFNQQKMNFKLYSQGKSSNQKLNLSQINKQLMQSDILQFETYLNTADESFIRQIHFVLNNWSTYQPFYQQQMEIFQSILMSYINAKHKIPNQNEKCNFYGCNMNFTSITQQAQDIVNRSSFINQYRVNTENIMIDIAYNKNNNLFANFLKDIQSVAARQGEIKIILNKQQKKALYEHIADHPEFQSHSRRAVRWQHILTKVGIKQFLKIREPLLNENDQEARTEYMNHIQTQKLLDLSCLGCCPFFYDGQNIRNSEINKTPFRVIESAQKVQLLKEQIKQAMKYLMDHTGGVILFDCLLKHRQVITKGVCMTTERMQEINNQLQAYFEDLQAKDMSHLSIKKEILISFVPIIKNPYKHKIKNQTRSYIDDTFVTRVKINRILNQNGFNEQQERQELFFGPKISCFHSGPCSQPEKIGEKSVKTKPKKAKQQPKQKQYLYLSLILDSKQNRDRLKKEMQKEKLGLIEIPFANFNLKCSSNTSLIFHDEPLSKIKEFISKKKQQDPIYRGRFNYEEKEKKQATLTQVTCLLLMSDRSKSEKNTLQQNDFLDMTKLTPQLQKQFEAEDVVYWQYKSNKNTQYYFYIKNKVKIALLYYILHNYSQKCKFKLPKGYENFTIQDMNKFNLVFKTKSIKKDEKQLKIQLLQRLKKSQIK